MKTGKRRARFLVNVAECSSGFSASLGSTEVVGRSGNCAEIAAAITPRTVFNMVQSQHVDPRRFFPPGSLNQNRLDKHVKRLCMWSANSKIPPQVIRIISGYCIRLCITHIRSLLYIMHEQMLSMFQVVVQFLNFFFC